MSRMPKSYDVDLPGCFIAGGAILSAATKTGVNDYDVYPKSNKAMIDAFYRLFDESCFVVNISDRAVTFKSNSIVNNDDERAIIQVMTYDEFETADKIFEHFDFTVCMGAFDCDTKQHIFHPDFYPDVASKTLRFNPKTRYPLNSLLRLTKYTAKGFYVSKPEHIRMILTAIDRGMPTDWAELESQIGGTYGREINLRCEGKPFTLETALEVLADINSFACYEEESLDEAPTPEHLEHLFSTEMKTVVVNGAGEYFIIDSDTMAIKQALGKYKPLNCVVINETEDLRMRGYKVLKELNDGTYAPGIYNYSKVRYTIGGETEELQSPYLYAFDTRDAANSRAKGTHLSVFEVSYDAKDLMAVSSNKREIQVTKMKVERKIGSEGVLFDEEG